MQGFDSRSKSPFDEDILFPVEDTAVSEGHSPAAAEYVRQHCSNADRRRIPIKRLLGLAALLFCLLHANSLFDEICPISIRHFPTFDKDTREVLASSAFQKAFRYLSAHKRSISNKKYLTVIDYTKPSHVKRLYLLNRETYEVERFLVAHGKNSGFSIPRRFSNDLDSLMSSKGFFLTGHTYVGSHGISLLLYGMERNVNDNALRRGIVIHGADYVNRHSVLLNHGRLGRSFGCPAVPASEAPKIIHKLKNGSLIYIHAGD